MMLQICPPVLASSGQEWQFYISTVRDEVADLPLVLASTGQELDRPR